jgi:hypothetical protein
LGPIGERVERLKTQPTSAETVVENAKGLRFAAANGKYDLIFNGLNAAMANIQ